MPINILMKKHFLVFLAMLIIVAQALSAYPVYYKEQYYRLFHQHYIAYPDDTIENIYWLEMAKKSAFCNPLYALAKIEDQKHWERYRYLMDMHLNLKLIEQHLALGARYDKFKAYFFNAPWKEDNLESLKIAETAYRTALEYWAETKALAEKAADMRFVRLDEVQFWIDESYRITTGDLDYDAIIGKLLARLEKVRQEFTAMDASTY